MKQLKKILFCTFISQSMIHVVQAQTTNVSRLSTQDSAKLALGKLINISNSRSSSSEKWMRDTAICYLLSIITEAEVNNDSLSKYNLLLEQKCREALRSGLLEGKTYQAYKRFYSSALNNIAVHAQFAGDFKKAMEYYDSSVVIKKAMNDISGLGDTYANMAVLFKTKGDLQQAVKYNEMSLKLREESGNKNKIAESLNNSGHVVYMTGDIPKALQYFHRSFEIQENMNDKKGMALSLNNIGFIYKTQADYDKAIDFYNRSLRIRTEINDRSGMAQSYINLGSVNSKRGNAQSGLEMFRKSLELYEELGQKNGIVFSLNNIGAAYKNKGDIKLAYGYIGKALKLAEEIGDKLNVIDNMNTMSGLLVSMGKEKEARTLAENAFRLSVEAGFTEQIRNSARALYEINKRGGNYEAALGKYELYIKMRDSINNESTRKASIISQLKYEYEKQAAADSVAHAKESEIKNAEIAKQTAEIKAKKNQQYALFGGLGLVIIFAGFMYNRFKITQKQKFIIETQKLEVEEQKQLVDEKQKEILDSINYARRIQMALMPSENQMSSLLTRSHGIHKKS